MKRFVFSSVVAFSLIFGFEAYAFDFKKVSPKPEDLQGEITVHKTNAETHLKKSQDLNKNKLFAQAKEETKKAVEEAKKAEEKEAKMEGGLFTGTNWLNSAEVFQTAESAQVTVNIAKGETYFPHVFKYFTIQSTPNVGGGSTSVNTTRDSILDKDGGIVNLAIGEVLVEHNFNGKSSVALDYNFGGKLVNAELNETTKTIGIGQAVIQGIWKSGLLNDDNGGVYLEFPSVVFNFANGSTYEALFPNANKNTVHIDASLRIFSKDRFAIAVGGTLWSNNDDLDNRVFVGLSYAPK